MSKTLMDTKGERSEPSVEDSGQRRELEAYRRALPPGEEDEGRARA